MTTTVASGRPATVPTEVSVLEPFVAAGVFGAYEVQFAATVLRLQPDLADEVVVALAVAARAPRFGHVCWRLADMAGQLAELDGDETDPLPWPPEARWEHALVGSAVVADPGAAGGEPLRPLVWDGGRLYLHRYWHYELAVARDLLDRATGAIRASGPAAAPGSPEGAAGTVAQVLDDLFGADDPEGPDLQRLAALRGMQPGVSIIAGGPGTGKTYTVARLLAAAHLVADRDGRELRVALAAPTGKAAARMGDAVKAAVLSLEADGVVDAELSGRLVSTDPTTVHALLGWQDRTHFRHHRDHPLTHDLVIVDETSMVSLPLMAKLLDAVRPGARLVLVGDPFQLASIEAGTVMRDVVGPAEQRVDGGPSRGPLAGRVTVLRRMRRFGEDSAIAALAEAVRAGDADAALAMLAEGRSDVRWVRPDDADGVDQVLDEVAATGEDMVAAARRGDAAAAMVAAGRIKVLAATRRGHLGLDEWTDRIEAAVSRRVDALQVGRRWYVGRPVLATANDRDNAVFNGDVGVVVGRNGGMEVALADGDGVRYLAPSRLEGVETWWAMTVHKSQGSEFGHAVVSLPDWPSPILTRELLYTAVTRARDRLTVVGSEDSLRTAIDRPLTRASGLQDRLWPS